MSARLVPIPPYREVAVFDTQAEAFTPRLLVLHSTEGGTPHSVEGTLHRRGFGIHWITGPNGAIVRGPIDRHVWHVEQYNSVAIGIEQCGFARWTKSDWGLHETQLLAAAWILAYDAQRHGIPLRFVAPYYHGPRDPARGVTFHSSLGVAGGGHTDPGAGYPVSHVLGMAVSIQTRGLGLRERARVALACRRVT